MNEFVSWLASTTMSTWVMDSAWVFPTLETLHFFGLCLLLGSLLIVDLRLMGCLRNFSLPGTHVLLRVTLVGFAINLISGVLFFIGDPERYAINISFQIKMLLVLLAAINSVFFIWKLKPQIADWGDFGDTSGFAKVVGAASLLLWLGVLVMGRLIPYLGTG